MKLKLTLALFVVATTAFAQTIRRVNADATVTGTNVYHTLQAAHDAATAGDVLIVEPGTTVGSLTCTKALTIYGRGYFLDKNSNYAALPNNASASTVGNITINANNVKLSGVSTGAISINGVSGVTISRNYIVNGISINGLASSPASNIVITQNYLPFFGISGGLVVLAGNATGLVSNVTISNNLIDFDNNYASFFNNQYCSGILFNQNLVTGYIGGVLYNTVVTNNIFTRNQGITDASLSNSIYSYNVFTSTSTYTASVGSNNILLSNLTAQFSASPNTPDNTYRIVNGSPLKTAGNTGGEVAMFGGATPYMQYGIPPGPALLKLLNSGLGNATTPINATISATSNN